MSRFRRQSLVKPLAAEVLEPRYLMTDALGAGLPTSPLEESAAPLTGDVVIGPDLWDDAGLTLLRDGDLVHVVHTGTTQDVIAPFAADAPGQLIIQGRDNASDVLTIDLAGATEPVGLYNSLLLARRLMFDGGAGAGTDELRLENAPAAGWWLDEFVFGIAAINDWSGVSVDAMNFSTFADGFFSAAYRQVELVTQPFGSYSEIGPSADAVNALANNVITVDQNRPNGMALVSYKTAGVSIQLFPWDVGVHGGPGNDRISVISSPAVNEGPVVRVDGSDGNDTLIGSRGRDVLDGGAGDDLIEAGAGNDTLIGNLGNDTIHGGSGRDTLTEFSWMESWLDDVPQISTFVLKQNSMNGLGNDVLSGIESADVWIIGRMNFDASAFLGSVSLRGSGYDDTLIGGSGADTLNGDGGSDLLIGGKGNDVLIYPDGWNNSGEAGVDTLCGGPGNDEYQTQSPELRPVIIDDEKELRAYLAKSAAAETTTVVATDPVSATVTTDVSAATISAAPANDATPDDDDLIPVQEQAFLVASPGGVLLIGQGIATVGIEDREWAEFDTARSDSAFGELADSEPEDDEGPTAETLADSGDLAAALGAGLLTPPLDWTEGLPSSPVSQ